MKAWKLLYDGVRDGGALFTSLKEVEQRIAWLTSPNWVARFPGCYNSLGKEYQFVTAKSESELRELLRGYYPGAMEKAVVTRENSRFDPAKFEVIEVTLPPKSQVKNKVRSYYDLDPKEKLQYEAALDEAEDFRDEPEVYRQEVKHIKEAFGLA